MNNKVNFTTVECRCPYCGKDLNRASDLRSKSTPKSGDWSVCLGCAEMLVFNDDLSVRKPTGEEREAGKKSKMLSSMQLLVRSLHAKKQGNPISQGGNA